MRSLISYLTKYLDDYLVIDYIGKKKFKRNELLLEAYITNQLSNERDELIDSNIKTIKDELSKSIYMISSYANALDFKRGYTHFNLKIKKQQDLIIDYNNAVSDKILYTLFDGFYKSNVNKKKCNFEVETSLDLILKYTDHESLIEEYRKSPSIVRDDILIEYYIASSYMNCNNDKYYPELKKLVFNKLSQLDHEASVVMLQKLQNFCIVKINAGNENYKKELFKTYDFYFFKSGIKFEKEYLLQPLFFRNVIKSAISVSEIKWAEKFLNKFISHIEPKFRKNFYNLFMSELKFEMKEFEESLKFHSMVNIVVLVQKLDYKLLHLKLLYELGYIEEAYYALDAAKHFLRRKSEVPEVQAKHFQNALKYYTLILDLKSGNAKNTSLDYLSRIINNENQIQKKWFLEKLDELENS